MSTRDLFHLIENLAVGAHDLTSILADKLRDWVRVHWVPADLDSDSDDWE